MGITNRITNRAWVNTLVWLPGVPTSVLVVIYLLSRVF